MEENLINNYISQAEKAYTYFEIGQISFIIVALIGLILILYGYYKKRDSQKKIGLQILVFGVIIATCLYLMEEKTHSNVHDAMNNPARFYEKQFRR